MLQPLAELKASIARSHTLHHPLFRSLECAIVVLRHTLHGDASNRNHHSPHTSDQPYTYIQQALPDPSNPSHYPSLLCLDLSLTLLHAALSSARSTTLVNPVPACFSAAASEETPMAERNDRVDVRVDGKFINAQLPLVEAAFVRLPKLTRIQLAPTPSHVQDSLSPSSLQPLQSLPLGVQQLLACMLSSHLRFRSVRPNPNLYTLGRTAAHRQAAALANSTTLTLPDYQFDLVPLPHPHLQQQMRRHSSRTVFHGSPLHNWHSISRHGLESKSGTREQTSGAMFGRGIYFSDDLRVARMFSGVQQAWPHSLLGDRLEVVGMYELVMDETGVRMGEEVVRGRPGRGESGDEAVPENYFVAADNSYFVLKSLLVWRVMERKGASVLRSSWTMLVGYVLLLLVVVASQLDWRFIRNLLLRSARYIQHYRA